MGTDAWIDQYSKDRKRYRITASGPQGSRRAVRAKNYREVLREYELHPEAKCSDTSGEPCGKQRVGLLRRRHISFDGFDYIGKESNKVEQVEEGGVLAESDVYTIHADSRRDPWINPLAKLRRINLSELQAKTGLDRRTLRRMRVGQKPHPRNQRLLKL